MRKELAKQEGVRKKFTATFSRIGKKKNFNGFSEDTILLTDVRDSESGEVIADHIWFAYSRTFEKAKISIGMRVSFEARVKQYTKGYVSKVLGVNRARKDFKLSHPTKIAVIAQ